MQRITMACFLGIVWMAIAVLGFPVSVPAGETPASGAPLDAQEYPVLSQSEVAVLKGRGHGTILVMMSGDWCDLTTSNASWLL